MKDEHTLQSSYQFRSSLSIVKSNMELLAMNVKDQSSINPLEDTCIKISDRVVKEVKKMTRIIDDSLIVEKVDIGTASAERKNINVGEIFLELSKILSEYSRDMDDSFDGKDEHLQIDVHLFLKLINELAYNMLQNKK